MRDIVGQGKPLYSSLDRAAGLLKRKVGTGSEFLKELMAIPGVKQTEVSERGLGELLNAPRMTHEQFMTALQGKPVPAIKEKVFADKLLKNPGAEPDTHHGEWTIPGGDNYREMLIKMPNQKERIEDLHNQMIGGNRTPEIEKEKNDLVMGRKAHPEVFPGLRQHYEGEPGIVASMRLKDRTGLNGEKLLHLEELQSDWHQQGRTHGYKPEDYSQQKLDSEKRLKESELKSKQIYDDFKEANKEKDRLAAMLGGDHPLVKNRPEYQEGGDRRQELEQAKARNDKRIVDLLPQVMQAQESHQQITEEHKNKFGTQSKMVPDAPFKKNWEEMALKRLVHHAAEKGYHGIVVTPGDEQADRYDLSKHVDQLMYQKNPDGTYQLSAQAGGRGHMLGDSLKEDELEHHVGKEVAQKIAKGHGEEQNLGGSSASRPPDLWKTMSGLDLKVGGEGMKGFYDKKVPNILNGIGKKYGVKTELNGMDLQGRGKERTPEEYEQAVRDAGYTFSTLPMNRAAEFDYHPKKVPAHYFPITDQMRQDVLKNGLPLYKEGGDVHMAEGGANNLSVLEMGDMSSPAYRAHLESKQGLEGSYPEMFVAPAIRGAASTVRGVLGNIGKPKPGQLSPGHYEFANAKRDVAMSQLSKQEMDAFYRTGNLPSRFPELLENASVIGSRVGKIPMPKIEKKTLQEHLAEKVMTPAGRRSAVDLGLNTANQMSDIYDRKGFAPLAEDQSVRQAKGGNVQAKPAKTTMDRMKYELANRKG